MVTPGLRVDPDELAAAGVDQELSSDYQVIATCRTGGHGAAPETRRPPEAAVRSCWSMPQSSQRSPAAKEDHPDAIGAISRACAWPGRSTDIVPWLAADPCGTRGGRGVNTARPWSWPQLAYSGARTLRRTKAESSSGRPGRSRRDPASSGHKNW